MNRASCPASSAKSGTLKPAARLSEKASERGKDMSWKRCPNVSQVFNAFTRPAAADHAWKSCDQPERSDAPLLRIEPNRARAGGSLENSKADFIIRIQRRDKDC